MYIITFYDEVVGQVIQCCKKNDVKSDLKSNVTRKLKFSKFSPPEQCFNKEKHNYMDTRFFPNKGIELARLQESCAHRAKENFSYVVKVEYL